MAAIVPNEWFLTDRDALVLFRNMIDHYNKSSRHEASKNRETDNPFTILLVDIPKGAKVKMRLNPEVVDALREVATIYSSFGTQDPVVVNTRGDTQPAEACGQVVLRLLDGVDTV